MKTTRLCGNLNLKRSLRSIWQSLSKFSTHTYPLSQQFCSENSFQSTKNSQPSTQCTAALLSTAKPGKQLAVHLRVAKCVLSTMQQLIKSLQGLIGKRYSKHTSDKRRRRLYSGQPTAARGPKPARSPVRPRNSHAHSFVNCGCLRAAGESLVVGTETIWPAEWKNIYYSTCS